MNSKFKKYILDFPQVAYPPYHVGKYLEEYFIDFYYQNKEEFDKTGYIFLPISWTNIYNNHSHLLFNLQSDLFNLDQSKKYFTVSQHDDAPGQILPPNTLKFSAGGNQPNCIPIPLICSGIPIPLNKTVEKKDIFCSFVGSATHPIRMKMLETLMNNKDYVLKPKHWSLNVEEKRKDLFLNLTTRSKFTLCPRGYGATSFRLYEAMQLKSVPVYIYLKEPYLPYKDKIDWNNSIVSIESEQLGYLDDILKSISEEKIKDMLKYTKQIYSEYFTLTGLCNNILKHLKTI
jgi:hypothetical protein